MNPQRAARSTWFWLEWGSSIAGRIPLRFAKQSISLLKDFYGYSSPTLNFAKNVKLRKGEDTRRPDRSH